MAIIFQATAVATFDNLSGGNFQRIFDLSNGPGTDSIWLGNSFTSDDIRFEVEQDGVRHNIIVPNAIDEGVSTEWRVTIEDTGTFTIFKDGTQIASQNLGLSAIPNDVPRTQSLIGDSPHAADDPLIGTVDSIDFETTLTNGFDMTFTDTVNVAGSFDGTDQAEVLDASAKTTATTIDGDAGDDTISGGTGDDRILLSNSHGNDSILGGEDGTGLDVDILDASGVTTGGVTVLKGSSEDGTLTSADGTVSFDEIERFVLTDQADSYDGNFSSAPVTLDGGAGDDTISEGTGDSFLIGGTGSDLFNLANGDATVVGGTSGADVDTISFSLANAASDAVTVVYTFNGVGIFTSLDGDDGAFSQIEALQLTDFDDSLDGSDDSAGLDVEAGAGNDTVLGGSGNDIIDAGAGNDSLQSSGGDDSMIGGDGDDFFDADTSPDGDDTLIGGLGNDTIQHDIADDVVDGGDGDDYIVNVDITASGSITTVTGGDGIDTYALDASEGGGFTSSQVVNLSIGHVTFNGSLRDVLSDFENIALVDTASGAIGDAGDNVITASGTFDNVLEGGAGNDSIDAGDGNDILTGGTGDDTLLGGLGDDTVVIENDIGTDSLVGGDGTDLIDMSAVTSGVTVTFSSNDAGTFINGSDTVSFDGFESYRFTDQADVIDANGTGISLSGTFDLGDGNDALFGGGSLAETVLAGTGDDTVIVRGNDSSVSGGDGNDDISVQFGNNSTLDGGAGDDSLRMEFGSGGTLLGGDGNDTLTGRTSADLLEGGTGNDSLFASGGADTLTGGDGQNTLQGGDGNDSLVGNATDADSFTAMEGGAGADTIDGTAGVYDIANYFTSADGVNVDLSDGLTESGGDAEGDTLSGIEQVDGSDLAGDTILAGTDTRAIKGFGGNDSLVGSTGSETLEGGDDDDTISGGAGADTLSGDGGNDDIFGGIGNDSILGGAGSDTISGGDDDDHIDAGSGNDSLQGGTGADTIEGGDGADAIEGGAGNDSILGGLQGDTISGGDGDDYIDGGDGDDLLTTGAGQDTLIGGEGADTLLNSVGDDSLVGGAGDDSIVATWGNDTLEGGTGNDTLIGGADDDSIEGGAGDDTIFSGTRNIPGEYTEQTGTSDSFTGTNGNSNFTGTTTSDEGSVNQITSGGLSGYWLGNSDGTETHTHSFSQQIAGVRVDFTAINVIDQLSFAVDGASVDLNTLIANGDAVFDGGVNFEVDGSGAIVLADGGSSGAIGSVTFLRPLTDMDVLSVAPFASGLVYEMHVDTNPPTDSDDDFLSGGDDDDTFIIEDAFGNDTIIGGENGSDDDVIDMSGLSGPVTVTFDAVGAESGTITDGIDTITFSEIERVILTDQDDSVDASDSQQGEFGNVAGVNIDARGGDDTILGGRGGDTIDGGTGADSIVGDYGDDSLLGGDGNDTIYGDATDGSQNGSDTIEGGAGADLIYGGNQSDSLVGGAGDDTLSGGDDNDTIIGGDGSDTIILNDGYLGDSITGGEDGDGSDVDVIDASGVTNDGVDVVLSGNEDGAITSTEGTANFAQIESFVLTGQADSFVGTNASSASIVDGGGGDDTLTGGSGSDTIDGGTGADVVDGGDGADELTGGSGADVFVVDGSADTITDFDATTGIDGGASDDNDFVDLTGFYNQTNLDAFNLANGTTFKNPLEWMRADQADDNIMQGAGGLRMQNGGSAVAASELNAENTGVVCFVQGTLIRTSCGEVPVEDLKAGDMVLTSTGLHQPITWTDHTVISKAQQEAAPNLRPVRIKPGAMGNDKALFVSQQHCMAIIIGGQSRFIRARHLAEYTPRAHITKPKKEVTYHHILLPEHAVIHANGAASESFYPGPQSLKMLSTGSLASLTQAVAPAFGQSVSETYGPRRFSCLTRKEIRTHVDLSQLDTTSSIAPRAPLETGTQHTPPKRRHHVARVSSIPLAGSRYSMTKLVCPQHGLSTAICSAPRQSLNPQIPSRGSWQRNAQSGPMPRHRLNAERADDDDHADGDRSARA